MSLTLGHTSTVFVVKMKQKTQLHCYNNILLIQHISTTERSVVLHTVTHTHILTLCFSVLHTVFAVEVKLQMKTQLRVAPGQPSDGPCGQSETGQTVIQSR